MKKILWISPYVPYDKVNHAGGQTENYYVKGIKKRGFDLRILSFCTVEELNKIDLNQYEIENDIILLQRDRISKIVRTIKYNILDSKYNPFNKYGNLVSNNFIKEVLKHIKVYKKQGYYPDIIVLEWTEAALLTLNIKKTYPNTKILCIEEDVAYLGYERHLEYATNIINKCKWKLKYANLKKQELNALRAADYIGCLNEKDSDLLYSDGVDRDKIFNWVPFFFNYKNVIRKPTKKCKIMFFGNMAREENYASVIWFIDNVIPLISDIDFEFNIIGANPADILYKYENERIHVVGFVDNVTSFFEESLCLVAPLVLGAGIKIKILEALSAGVPVLTNKIGIEGIPAKNGLDYMLCSTPEEYANYIHELHLNGNLAMRYSDNAKLFIENQYNIQESLEKLCTLLESI